MLGRYITIVLAPMLALLLAVYQQVRAINIGYELEDLRVEVSSLVLQEETLESELAEMKSPKNLLASARELGMEFELPVVVDSRIASKEDLER